jgi:outer membrane protein
MPFILTLASAILFPVSLYAGQDAESPLELTLDQCIRTALEQNATVLAAREEANAAAARERIAFSAYLPTLTATASYTAVSEISTVGVTTNPTFYNTALNTAAWWGIAEAAGTAAANSAFDNRAIDPSQTFNKARQQAAAQFPETTAEPTEGTSIYQAALLLQQPLFTGGKIYYGNKMAQTARAIENLTVNVREDDVVLNATLAYEAAVATRNMERELGDLQVRLTALRDSVKNMLAAGSSTATDRDLARIEMAIATAEKDVADSHKAAETSLAALREVMGLDHDASLRPVEPAADSKVLSLSLEACEAIAADQRTELAQTKLATRLRDHGVSLAKANYWPDIGAFAGYQYLKDEPNYLNPDHSGEWFAGVALTLPIFTGFSRSAKVAEARSNALQARLTETEAQRGVLLQVREAYHSLKAAEQKCASSEKLVAEADRFKAITLAARSQHIGVDYERMLVLSDNPDIMEFKKVPDLGDEVEAEVLESQSRIERLKAVFERDAARALLSRALGVRSLLEPDQ